MPQHSKADRSGAQASNSSSYLSLAQARSNPTPFPPFPAIQTQFGGSRNELRDPALCYREAAEQQSPRARGRVEEGTAPFTRTGGADGRRSMAGGRASLPRSHRHRPAGGLRGSGVPARGALREPPRGCRQRGTARLSRHSTAVTGIKQRRPRRLTLQSPALPAGCLVHAARIPFQPISPSPEGNS